MELINKELLAGIINGQQKDIANKIDEQFNITIRNELNKLFVNDYVRGPTGGYIEQVPVAKSMIQDLITEHTLNELTSNHIKEMIQKRFLTILTEETEAAMRKRAKHEANKTVFSSRNDRNSSDSAASEQSTKTNATFDPHAR